MKASPNASALVLSVSWVDWHLLLLLLPLALGIASYFLGRWVQRRAPRVQRSFSILFGFALIASSVVSYVFAVVNGASDSSNQLLPLIHLQNLDLIIAFLGGYGLLRARYGLTRAIAPVGVILAATKIINNPGAQVASYEIATAILIGSLPLFTFAFSHRLSWRQALITSSFDLPLLLHLSILNKTLGTNFGAMATSELARNPFYSFLNSSVLQVGAYIGAFIVAQLLAFLIISWLAHGQQNRDYRWKSFSLALQDDEIANKKQIANYGLFSWYALQIKAPSENLQARQQLVAFDLLVEAKLVNRIIAPVDSSSKIASFYTHFVRALQSVGDNAPNFSF